MLCPAFGLITFFTRKYLNNTKYSSDFMILNFAIKIIGWVGYIYASSLWMLYAIQILFAIGEALGSTSYALLYSLNLTKGDYATDWGLDKSVNSFHVSSRSFYGVNCAYFVLLSYNHHDMHIHLEYSIRVAIKSLFNKGKHYVGYFLKSARRL